MKILYVVPSYKPAYVYGGPIESVAKLCEGVASAGHEVYVYTTAANGKTELNVALEQEMNIDGVKVTYFKRITKDHTHISPRLWGHLAKTVKQYDIVNIQSWWNPLVIAAAYICYKKGVKFTISPRGMLSNYVINSGNSMVKKLIHNSVGKFILGKSVFHATSELEYQECKALIKNWDGFMLPNILSLPDNAVVTPDNKVFTIIFMSRIHPKKGIEILLEALGKVEIDFVLKIAGSGDEEYIKHLNGLAHDLNIDSKIEWLGWKSREEKFDELMNADVFALISYNENFANVVVESLHMGTAVVISEYVGLSDFVNKQNMGWITSLDVENVKEKLEQAARDDTKRALIKQTGRAVIEEAFSEKKLIGKYIDKYQEILQLVK